MREETSTECSDLEEWPSLRGSKKSNHFFKEHELQMEEPQATLLNAFKVQN